MQVADPVHVVYDERRCYAAIVTELDPTERQARVQSLFPPGALVPWPGKWHRIANSTRPGDIHTREGCHHRMRQLTELAAS